MSEISVQIGIYVGKDWDERVNKYCKDTGRVKGRLIQIAVEKYIEENS